MNIDEPEELAPVPVNVGERVGAVPPVPVNLLVGTEEVGRIAVELG